MTLETKPLPVVETYPEMPPIARRLWEARQAITDPAKWWNGQEKFSSRRIGIVRCMHTACGDTAQGMEAKLWLSHFISGEYNLQRTFDFNDSHTHAEVLAKMDEAIAAALAEGK